VRQTHQSDFRWQINDCKKDTQTWKHVPDFYTYHLRSVKLWQDKRVDKLAGKSTRRTLRERVHILKIASTTEVSILENLKNLLAPIEEIGYFTYSNNSDIVSPSEALPNSIFDDVACDKQDAIREYFSTGRHADVWLLLSLSDICKDTKASYTRQRKSFDSFQTGWYQSETCVQWSRKHRHVLRKFLRIMSELLVTKIWIPSDWQGQCTHWWYRYRKEFNDFAIP